MLVHQIKTRWHCATLSWDRVAYRNILLINANTSLKKNIKSSDLNTYLYLGITFVYLQNIVPCLIRIEKTCALFSLKKCTKWNSFLKHRMGIVYLYFIQALSQSSKKLSRRFLHFIVSRYTFQPLKCKFILDYRNRIWTGLIVPRFLFFIREFLPSLFS